MPVADRICREQAKRLGKEYPMSFADNALEFRSWQSPALRHPGADPGAGPKFYDELSPETGAFFRTMLEGELLDVLSTEGKEGEATAPASRLRRPFIFANFNGTQGDVEVVTHEAGPRLCRLSEPGPGAHVHGLAQHGGLRGPLHVHGVHGLALVRGFLLGQDTHKFHYSHLSSALTFIPYGTMVDHFQHIVYERPDLTPAQRHGVWKELLGIYMPWMKLDGEIPFYAEGRAGSGSTTSTPAPSTISTTAWPRRSPWSCGP